MSFIEAYEKLKNKISEGDFSFIGLNHKFFQILLNLISEPIVLHQILENTHDPFVKTIIETFIPLSKAYFPIRDDKVVLRNLRKGIMNIEQYIYSVKDDEKINNILVNIFSYNFLYDTSYLNCNIRYLLSSWSMIFKNYAKNSVIYHAPHAKKTGRYSKKIRIGFFSDRIFKFTSVFRDRGLTIKNLDRSKFEVIVFTSESKQTEFNNEDESYIKKTLDTVVDSVDKIVYLSSISRKTVEQIANHELDILVYPDIGMDAPTFYMAHSRLAPVQINTWGHSKTSGIDTIDYYFSSKYFELENYEQANSHYSEKLVLFDSLSTCYPKFPISEFISREDLKNYPLKEQDEGVNVLFCLQNPRKISLEFMGMLYKLHTEYPKKFIVLLLKGTKYKGDDLISRFKPHFDPIFFKETIRTIEECSFIRYNSYMYHSDLVLDTYPFGCCNSSLEAFIKGKVVITRPAEYLSGRFTLGFYKRMGITEGPITNSEEEFIERIVYYTDNKSEREKLSKHILDNCDSLFNEMASVREWENRCIELVKPYVKLGEQIVDERVNITEDELKINELVKKGNYSFIQYNDRFFQFIFNKIVDKKLLDNIIRNIKDPIIQQFFKTVKYLSKAYYPVKHENIVISVINKELDYLLEIQKKFPVHECRIGLALFPYLYELSYFNHNKAPLLKKYAQFITGLGLTCQRYIRSECYKKKKRRRVKVGVISFMINQLSSVFRDRSNIIKGLNRDKFEVTVCSVPFKYRTEMEQRVLTDFNKSIEHYKMINVTDLDELKSLDFDIVIYPDIGMTGNSIIVAYNRLAPVQINTWGHSVTSGIPTIDYYMSSKFFELDDLNEAKKHYSEKLIAMDSLCTCYPKFEYEEYDSREMLGLPPKGECTILFCLQNPRKINKTFMNTLYKIYKAYPNILILLLKGIQQEDDLIGNYLNNKSLDSDFVKAIKLVNYTSLSTYNSYMEHSDIVLDPYPFGGCNSSLEAFSKGKIVITRPAEYLSGRFTLGFYKRMGIVSGGPIVSSEEEYIEKTLFYINETHERMKLSEIIRERSKILYYDEASIREWEDTLMELVKPYVKLVK